MRELASTTKVSSALEDAVLVVFPDKLALICTPAAYEEVMPRLALWGSALEVHCCTGDELQDPDLQEAFKLRSFVAVMASVRRVRASLSLHWRCMRPHRTVGGGWCDPDPDVSRAQASQGCLRASACRWDWR